MVPYPSSSRRSAPYPEDFKRYSGEYRDRSPESRSSSSITRYSRRSPPPRSRYDYDDYAYDHHRDRKYARSSHHERDYHTIDPKYDRYHSRPSSSDYRSYDREHRLDDRDRERDAYGRSYSSSSSSRRNESHSSYPRSSSRSAADPEKVLAQSQPSPSKDPDIPVSESHCNGHALPSSFRPICNSVKRSEPERFDPTRSLEQKPQPPAPIPSGPKALRIELRTQPPPASILPPTPPKEPPTPSPLTAKPAAPALEVSSRSFGHVPLPSELDASFRNKNFMLEYDPDLVKGKPKGKLLIKKAYPKDVDKLSLSVLDPRLGDRVSKGGAGRQKLRNFLYSYKYPWDTNSPGPRPPPPPRQILVTGLSPLTNRRILDNYFRQFGRIESSDLKVHPHTGQTMGIMSLTYAHDYDEDGKPKEQGSSNNGTLQDGHKAAKSAINKANGTKIDKGIATVVLDRDSAKYMLAFRAEIARLNAPKTAATTSTSSSASPTGSSTPKSIPKGPPSCMPPPTAPRGPRAQMNRPTHSASPLRQVQDFRRGGPLGHRSNWDRNGLAYVERSADIEDGYAASRRSSLQYNYHDNHHHHHNNNNSPYGRQQQDVIESTASIMKWLSELGNQYVFVPRAKASGISNKEIERHFDDFQPRFVAADQLGWYVAFASNDAASRSQMVLQQKALGSYRLSIEVRSVPPAGASTGPRQTWEEAAADNERQQRVDPAPKPIKTEYTQAELEEASIRMIRQELIETLIKDVKARMVSSLVADLLKPNGKAGQILKPVSVVTKPGEQGEAGKLPLPSFKKKPMLDFDIPKKPGAEQACRESKGEADEEMPSVEEIKTKARTKKSSAARRRLPEFSDDDSEEEEGSTSVEPGVKPTIKKVTKKIPEKKVKAAASPVVPDLFASGVAEDDEDLYFVKLALERMQLGQPVGEDWVDDDSEQVQPHPTGSARTEGFYRIPPAEKALHLPVRQKKEEETDTIVPTKSAVPSARNHRADSRRLVLGIEQHKKETATDTDILKFNQLQTRKKPLKFAKSPIHDWGLYAMELIPPGDMVIEYVGEVVRQQVADEREKAYERQGNFSTYLFRVDDDLVVDATHKGNIARLINHCCTPNCTAKILTLNGKKRIVIFAKTAIFPGEELTYDYKFQASADDEDAIRCLCGSAGCRKFL